MIFLILFQSFLKVGIVVHYSLNKNYYSQVLCENKNKPELKCHGKCKLNKRIQRVDKQFPHDENQSKPIKCIQEQVIEFNYPQAWISETYYIRETFRTQHEKNNTFIHTSFHTRVFHPPKKLV